MIILAENYGKENHYLCKAASLTTLTLDAMLEMANCSWCTRSLDDDTASLKRILTVLNLFSLPANQADYKQCVNMKTRISNLHREEQLGQHV